MMKLSGVFLVLVSIGGIVSSPNCDQQKPKAPNANQSNKSTPAPTATPQPKETPTTMEGEVKELAAGTHCTVFESFVLVARDQETYAALRSMNQNINLPDEDADFFKSHAVIAAFLGQRSTGGFAVDISRGTNGEVKVLERGAKGAMVIQVLTTAFRIVSVPVAADASITLALDQTWKSRLRTYQVNSGHLSVTGGFAGIHESSNLEGSLQVMRIGTWATLIFDVKSTSKGKLRQLKDVASGTVTEAGMLSLARLDSHSLSGAIQSPFKATGQFTGEETPLSLDLETVAAPGISDNFEAKASLKATATTPPPPHRVNTGKN
jgi:hypothetical protein